jgi:hypothetical protein
MKKLLFAIAASLWASTALPIVAVDFGLTLSNDSTYTHQDDGSWQQANRALAWLSSPIGSSADLYVSGFYEFKGTYYSDASSDVKPWRFDAGRVEFSGSSPALFGPSSAFRYSLGRINTGDFSTLVLSGLSDGTRLEADLGNASLYLSGGYRGLLYKNDAYSLMDANDLKLNADDDRYLAPPRAFAGIGARLTEFVKEHDIGFEVFGQFDCSDSSEKIHTQYLEPYIEGKLSHLLSWQAWGILGLGEERGDSSDNFRSVAAGEMLRFSLPEKAGLKLTQTASWANGGKGSVRAFIPIRQASIDATNFFTFSDLLKVKLDASIMPLANLAVDAGLAAYFRDADVDPETQAALRPDAGYYRGFEFSAGASAKVRSDLSLNLSGGVFIPDTSTAYPSGTKPRSMVELYAAFNV